MIIIAIIEIGMIPLALACSTNLTVNKSLTTDGDDPVEQALDENENDNEETDAVEPPLKRARKKSAFDDVLDDITVLSSCPGIAYRKAAIMSEIMRDALASSEFLRLCSELCGCNLSSLLDGHVMQYSICEHRRLLCAPRKRKWRHRLTDCKFCDSHRVSVKKMREKMVRYLVKKYPYQCAG